jgi:hypothetical protein
MSVDLKSNTMFARISLVLLDDGLIKLEHGRTEDRVRRYKYDRIERVLIWSNLPAIRVILCIALLMLPGFGVLLIGETFAYVTGALLIALGLGLVTWYLYCRKTTIQIVRSGKRFDVVGIFRPGKLRRFRDRLIRAIEAAQQRDAAASAAAPSLPSLVGVDGAQPPDAGYTAEQGSNQ